MGEVKWNEEFEGKKGHESYNKKKLFFFFQGLCFPQQMILDVKHAIQIPQERVTKSFTLKCQVL